jgi:hypothetical protein
VATHGRKYGEKDSHPIPVWNGIFDHYERIGIALWTFEWLIDRIPKDGERNGIGKVLGGKPIKIGEIMETMRGSTYKSVRGQLDTLEEQGYISRRRTPYGFVIEVRNSRKWGIWTPKESGQKGQSLPLGTGQKGQSDGERVAKKGAQICQKGQNKENTAIHSSKETQQEAEPAPGFLSPWKVLGSDLPMGSLRFQGIFEHYFSTRNGNPVSEVMERVIQRANKTCVGVPPKFYEAKRAVERREAEETASAAVDERPELEELAWRKR